MILLDLSHTSHTRARTGIQKVCRSIFEAFQAEENDAVKPITWDPYMAAWRTMAAQELTTLASESPSPGRKAVWPVSIRMKGRLRRWTGAAKPRLPSSTDGLIVPEIFSPQVGRALPALMRDITGPRVALFHDAIALKLPEFTPSKTVGRFPLYLRELASFDGVAAVSEDSRAALADWWRWSEIADTPNLACVPLAVDVPRPDAALARRTAAPVILSVGSLEGRKNHLALLDACEALWSRGVAFELRLIGIAHPQTGRAALSRVRAMQASGRALRYDGAVDERALRAAYHECAFTVYPSLMEGFGLPVLESLNYGKPCICAGSGALGESARGGGCLTVPNVEASTLASAIERLLKRPEELAGLAAVAQTRTFKRWDQYTAELRAWMETLPRRT